MAYYDFSSDYGGNGQPETEIPETNYDADAPYQFLCDGTGGKSSCDFGYELSLTAIATSGRMYFRYREDAP